MNHNLSISIFISSHQIKVIRNGAINRIRFLHQLNFRFFFRAWFGLQISFRVQALINQSFWILFTKQNKKTKSEQICGFVAKKQLLYSHPSIRLG